MPDDVTPRERHRGRRAALAAGWLLGAAVWAGAPAGAKEQAVEPAAPAARPRIALVLSGGGARGFAHVGVLRALEDLRIPIDMVAGVSMGAVVGGAYAAGRSVDEMEAFVRSTDWTAVVADRAPRDVLAFRRREDDLILPSRIEFGIGTSGVLLPPSTAGNATLESALTRLLPVGAADRPLNRLALPFRSVAADLLTGQRVDLIETPLFMSIRASLAVPGVFAPVRLDQRLVVDGGLVRNLPVDVAREMGADVIIAVNVGTPLSVESELGDALGVARQMMLILTEQNVQRSLQELRPQDVLIAPPLEGISFLDFSRSEQAMAAGERAVRRQMERLLPYSVSKEAYAASEAARTGAATREDAPARLARIEIAATPHAGEEALRAQFGLREGQPASAARIHAAASRLLGRGEFDRIEVDIREAAEGRELFLRPVEADWARSRLRLGLEVVSDFKDDHRFTLGALHTLAWLNSWGAELRTLVRIGSQRLWLTELWQPLAPGSEWHLAPSVQYSAGSIDGYVDGRRVARAGYSLATATLAVGRLLSDWGNVQLGINRRAGRSRQLVPEDEGDRDSRLAQTARHVQFEYDTLDSLALPSRGSLLQMRHEHASASSSVRARDTSSIVALTAFRVSGWDGHLYGEWARASAGTAPGSLGGFLRLSGMPRDSVAGRSIVFGRVVMASRIGEMPAGLGGAARAGYSLEFGNGYERDRGLRLGEMKQAASLFLSVDTRFGPLFLALGGTRAEGGTVYLFLGPFW